MIYERIQQEHQRLQEQINKLQTELSTYPEGKLVCCNHGNYHKWYKSDGHSKIYIPKGDRPLAEQLARKKYLSTLLEELSQERDALDAYLKLPHPLPSQSVKLLTENSGYTELLSPYFKPLSQMLTDWMNAPYEQNTKHPEHLLHKTGSGHLVRSKSEAMIDMILSSHQIPFRYECVLYLDEVPYYPDFTIRHPRTGETFYWEHFGRMDDPSYCKLVSNKLQTYISYGIIPSIHLITTYETNQKPLTTEVIEKIISHYFS